MWYQLAGQLVSQMTLTIIPPGQMGMWSMCAHLAFLLIFLLLYSLMQFSVVCFQTKIDYRRLKNQAQIMLGVITRILSLED